MAIAGYHRRGPHLAARGICDSVFANWRKLTHPWRIRWSTKRTLLWRGAGALINKRLADHVCTWH
jgi:hypothetical protein